MLTVCCPRVVRPNLQGKAVTREATSLAELRRGNMKERWAGQEESPLVERGSVVLLLMLLMLLHPAQGTPMDWETLKNGNIEQLQKSSLLARG